MTDSKHGAFIGAETGNFFEGSAVATGESEDLLGKMFKPQAHGITEIACGFDDGLAWSLFQSIHERPVDFDVPTDGPDRIVIHQGEFEITTARKNGGGQSECLTRASLHSIQCASHFVGDHSG